MPKLYSRAALSAALLVSAAFAAWPSGGSEKAPEPASNWTIDEAASLVRDKAGYAVPLGTYRRMVVASPGAVETLYLIGAESAIAAIADTRGGTWPRELTAALPSVGNVSRPSLEAVIATAPDLVVVSAMGSQLAADLSGRGYRVLIHNAESIEDIFQAALALGRLTGRTAEAERLVAEKRSALDSLAADARAKPLGLKGAFLYSTNPVMGFTEKSLPGGILEILGVRNIAAGMDAARPIISPETLIAEDPDFLFGAMSIAKPEDVLGADSAILKTRAGREKNIKIVDSALFLRPSPRIVDGILELRAALDAIGARR